MNGAVCVRARSSSSRMYRPVEGSTFPLCLSSYEGGRSCETEGLPVGRDKNKAPDASGPAQITIIRAITIATMTVPVRARMRRTRTYAAHHTVSGSAAIGARIPREAHRSRRQAGAVLVAFVYRVHAIQDTGSLGTGG